MTLARRAAAALALVLAGTPAPASAYVRTTDRDTGVPLSWPLPAIPWHLNRDWPHTSPSCQVTPAGDDPALAAIRASFAQWQQSCTDVRLLYAGGSSEVRVGSAGAGANVVVFRRGWCSQNLAAVSDPCFTAPDGDCASTYDCFDDGQACVGSSSCSTWATVALTSVLYDPSTGRMLSADIEVNGWDGGGNQLPGTQGQLPSHGWYFTCYPDPAVMPTTHCTQYGQGDCSYLDLQNTVTHEVGHVLGLAHPCTTVPSAATATVPLCTSSVAMGEVPYQDRTMAPSTSPGETSKRSLSADDVAGVCAVYPAASGGCGCGAGAGAGALSLLVLSLALRPRRPRAVTRR